MEKQEESKSRESPSKLKDSQTIKYVRTPDKTDANDDFAGDLSFQRTTKQTIGVKRSYNQAGKKKLAEPGSSQKRRKVDNSQGGKNAQNSAN